VKVGIFDDHAVVREGVRWMLADIDGLEVVCEAEDAHGAIAALRSGGLDVAFLDLRMGGTSGFDVLEAVSREQLPAAVVVWSMHDEPAHVRRAKSLGAGGYLLKSSGRERVLQALESIRRGDFFLDPDVVMPPDPEETPLSDDDRNVLELMAAGLDPASIARRLERSETSIRQTQDGLCSRWGVSTSSELVALAIRAGVVR
jgi:DNA-binding NarL/FixJ family response regulator